jgi:hypothetical protein
MSYVRVANCFLNRVTPPRPPVCTSSTFLTVGLRIVPFHLYLPLWSLCIYTAILVRSSDNYSVLHRIALALDPWIPTLHIAFYVLDTRNRGNDVHRPTGTFSGRLSPQTPVNW